MLADLLAARSLMEPSERKSIGLRMKATSAVS